MLSINQGARSKLRWYEVKAVTSYQKTGHSNIEKVSARSDRISSLLPVAFTLVVYDVLAQPFHTHHRRARSILTHRPDSLTIVSYLEACYLGVAFAQFDTASFSSRAESRHKDIARTPSAHLFGYDTLPLPSLKQGRTDVSISPRPDARRATSRPVTPTGFT